MEPLFHQQIASPTSSYISAKASFIDERGSLDVANRHTDVSSEQSSHTGPSRHKQEDHRFHPYDKALRNGTAREERKARKMLAPDDSLDALATLIEEMDIRKIPLHVGHTSSPYR